MKHAQEIFARADGEVEHASAGAPFVVEEGERIVQVGATEQYEIKFTESDGPSLPVVFKRHSCSELTYVHSVGKDMAMKKGRDQLVPDSVLLVVQSYPVSSLAHDQVMHRLRSAKWPVTLRFSRPLTDSDVTPLARCLQLEQQGELPDDLKLQMLKRLLSKGVAVKKHGSRTVWQSKFHGAFVASTCTPSTRRRLDGVAMPLPRRSTEPEHPTDWSISTQVKKAGLRHGRVPQ
jgi:hypothetical protein